MRVDRYGSATAEIISPGPGAAATSGGLSAALTEDKATLSSESVSVPSLAEQALKAAEARLSKVGALQRAVSSGAYTLDPGLIAQALIADDV